MMIDGIDSKVDLYDPSGWSSIISKTPDDSSCIIKRVFECYTQSIASLDVPLTSQSSEKLRHFRIVIRNYFMEALISGNKKQALELCHAVKFLGEDFTKLFRDIDQFISAGYNPLWRIGLVYLLLLRKQKPDTLKFIKEMLKQTYDGEGSISTIDNDQLLAYRVVNSIKKVFITQKNSLCDIAVSKYHQLDRELILKNSDAFDSFDFTFYYLVLLMNHQKLRDSITSLILRYGDSKEKLNLSADDLVDILLNKDTTERKKILRMLDQIRQCTDMSYFHIDLKQFNRMTFSSIKPLDISLIKVTKHQAWETKMFNLSLTVSLPYMYRESVLRKSIVRKYIDQTSHEDSKNPKIDLHKVHTIAQWLYQTTETLETFKKEAVPVAIGVFHLTKQLLKERSIKKKLERSKKKELENYWNLLCSGELDTSDQKLLLKEITIECVRLIRQVKIGEINHKLSKFDLMEEIACKASQKTNSSTSSQLLVLDSSRHIESSSQQYITTKSRKVSFSLDPIKIVKEKRDSSFSNTSAPPLRLIRKALIQSELTISSNSPIDSDPTLSTSFSSKTDSDTRSELTPRTEASIQSELTISSNSPIDSDPTLSTSFSPSTDSDTKSELTPSTETSKKVLEITHFFNNLVDLTVYNILAAENDRNAVNVIKNCLSFAKMAVEADSPNLHVAYAIIAALETNTISRLKFLFNALPKKDQKIYEKFSSLFSPLHNYREYRAHVSESSVPIIPFIGIHEKDILGLTESSGEDQEEVIIKVCKSFQKMQHLLKVAFFINPLQTDCVRTINQQEKTFAMKAPPRKIDINIDEEFETDDWGILSISEKLGYISRYRNSPKKRS